MILINLLHSSLHKEQINSSKLHSTPLKLKQTKIYWAKTRIDAWRSKKNFNMKKIIRVSFIVNKKLAETRNKGGWTSRQQQEKNHNKIQENYLVKVSCFSNCSISHLLSFFSTIGWKSFLNLSIILDAPSLYNNHKHIFSKTHME